MLMMSLLAVIDFSGGLDWLVEQVQTPTGMVIIGALLVLIKAKWPVVGGFLTDLFDKYLRPANAAPPPGCIRIDPLPMSAAANPVAAVTIEGGAAAFQKVVNYWRSNGMSDEQARKIMQDTSPYWIHSDSPSPSPLNSPTKAG